MLLPITYEQAERDFLSDDRFQLDSLRQTMEVIAPEKLVRFGNFIGMAFGASVDSPQRLISEELRVNYVNELLPLLIQDCRDLSLDFSSRQLERMRNQLAQGPIYQLHFSNNWNTFENLLLDEMDSKLFFRIPIDRSEYFTDWSKGWDAILDRFPSAALDVEEAGKCFALGRYTGAVVHLMRAAEPGLYSMARSLGMTNVKDNWGLVIQEMEKLLKNRGQNPPKGWKSKEPFYVDAAAQFRYFKDAWRNHVMHSRLDFDFTEEKALSIYRSVQVFMAQIALRLKERR